ncbi:MULTISPECIES: helix-turn-helix transcriptional regulator [unclassified Lactobacillus]|uniref:helix-turn-helix transcriptional regulator n=1 Tax=unclassified Lactobacillus TaxID=2620435 RepID=UPI000EFBEF86|nr:MULTISPECIES: helix-turn-helix transcriptional regulator [unclassified Lactobacillus]RMC26335.1 transcriptional regulator [Lactobacillus sp. ESL0247]RMC29873.1 transcriptional regulator [Lactobacillus sp. ESL0246]RMC34530.1 transcriptional regulator [Lactobacillus sp. ESL0245]
MKKLVKKAREKRKLTQASLAEKVGVNELTINSIEQERYQPSIILAYKLAQIFDTNIETLFCLQEYFENEER